MSWLPRFFPADQPFQEQFATEAADDLVFLGIEAVPRKWWNVVNACEKTLRAVAPPDVFGGSKPYFVADVQQHLEILARAADAVGANNIAASLRSPISRPKDMGDDSWSYLLSALENRRGHLEDEIERYHGSSMSSRREPVAALLEFIKAQRAVSTNNSSAES